LKHGNGKHILARNIQLVHRDFSSVKSVGPLTLSVPRAPLFLQSFAIL